MDRHKSGPAFDRAQDKYWAAQDHRDYALSRWKAAQYRTDPKSISGKITRKTKALKRLGQRKLNKYLSRSESFLVSEGLFDWLRGRPRDQDIGPLEHEKVVGVVSDIIHSLQHPEGYPDRKSFLKHVKAELEGRMHHEDEPAKKEELINLLQSLDAEIRSENAVRFHYLLVNPEIQDIKLKARYDRDLIFCINKRGNIFVARVADVHGEGKQSLGNLTNAISHMHHAWNGDTMSPIVNWGYIDWHPDEGYSFYFLDNKYDGLVRAWIREMKAAGIQNETEYKLNK
jgi:hypothetical protein